MTPLRIHGFRLSRITPILVVASLLVMSHVAVSQIAQSKHNLSTTGPGTIKSSTETEICKFCHIAHNAILSTPLWGHQLSSAGYTPYTSGTMTSSVTATITGATKLCLSCHDGQVAVNALGNGVTPLMLNGVNFITGASNLGTVLTADHPVSFIPDTVNNRQIKSPQSNGVAWGEVHLDNTGVLQCTACHDPHKYDRDAVCTKFLEGSNRNSALCTACHVVPNWAGSAHQSSSVTYTPAQGQHTGYTTVGENGCESCHKPHKAPQAIQLLNGNEEAACTPCHEAGANGSTRTNISNNGGPFSKLYTHPTFTASGKHSPKSLNPRTLTPSEDVTNLSGTNRHAECQDCHNEHQAGTRATVSGNHYNGTSSYPTNLVSSSLTLNGVWGVEPATTAAWSTPPQATYTRQDPVSKEYQLCLKCHSAYAYGSTPPTSPSTGTNGVTAETDQALEFNTSNASYHGVQAAPSGVKGTYNAPWTATSTMYCSDCHGEDATATTWSAPSASGPHGSNNPFITTGAWSANTGKSTTSDLCFRCHDYNTFINGDAPNTKFSASSNTLDLHKRHVGDQTGAATNYCMNCHVGVPHGWKRPSLIVLQGDGAPYEVVNVAKIKTWNRNSGNYAKADCSTDTGCH